MVSCIRPFEGNRNKRTGTFCSVQNALRKSVVKRGEKRLKKYKTNYSDWL